MYFSLVLTAVTLFEMALPQVIEAETVRISFEEISISAVHVFGASNGIPDSYQAFRGKVYGEINPRDPHNAIIQDIQLVPRNANGNVEYVATFTLLKPKSTGSSHVLVYEIVNRGASVIQRDYSSETRKWGNFGCQFENEKAICVSKPLSGRSA